MLIVDDGPLRTLIGGRAQLWGFHATHSRLAVRIKLPERVVWYVSFVFCVRLALPTSWEVTAPRSRRDGDYIDFSDRDVHIRCMEMSLWDFEQ